MYKRQGRGAEGPLRIAVPKGSLKADTLDVLEAAGLDVSEPVSYTHLQTLQDILDGIMPGMLGMLAFWLYYWLLSKKINPMVLILSLIHI